jgi:hypothetical protein
LLFEKSAGELEGLQDPFLDLAIHLYREREGARKRNERLDAELSDLRRQYIKVLSHWKGKTLSPDANSTIRFSFGPVAGYSPLDAVSYAPFTTLKGVLEKETGKKPFIVPGTLNQLYKDKNFGTWIHPDYQDVPVNFIHEVDSTGGNSGSPVFDENGDLVGILFDGNYEALTSDWQYDRDIQRSISVDIRYVMFVTEKLARATHIMRELDLSPDR